MTRTRSALALALLCTALGAAEGPLEQPTIVRIGAADRDLLAVTISTDGWIRGEQQPYEAQPGDELKVEKRTSNGEIKKMVLIRDGAPIGFISGADDDWFMPFEDNRCPPLDVSAADRSGTYRLSSDDDAAFGDGVQPTAVIRKSKQSNWLEPDRMRGPITHTLFLQLPAALTPGARYELSCRGLGLADDRVAFTFDPQALRSPSIHVNQVGFRADDPAKRAYLSLWTGPGGGHDFADDLGFQIVDEAGNSVHQGRIGAPWPADRQEYSAYGTNAAKSDVHPIDFGGLTRPGTYRVVVDGIGCSYPFTIGDDAWHRAFVTSLRGFFLNRSGIERKPPHSEIVLERDMHPADGVAIYRTTFDVTDGGANQGGVFKGLIANRTDEQVTNAWGGYHDAGDWDRRIQHLDATSKQLELLELFPERAAAIDANIPKVYPQLPDLLEEALWNLDCFRRMQTEEAGIPHGIESAAHPRDGEVSWRESLSIFVFAPDVWSTYRYCSVAAQAASVLAGHDPKLAATYRESALQAWAWADARYDEWKAKASTRKYHNRARDLRNLSALMLYRLTGDEVWHQRFLEDSWIPKMAQTREHKKHSQQDAPFVYARLPDGMGDPALKAKSTAAIEATARAAMEYGANNAFNLHHPTKYMPRINGFWSAPPFPDLARAHFLTGDAAFLEALNLAVGFGLGANPMDMVLTTGVGSNPARHPLHIDSRNTGQPAPEGLTLYGICDLDWAQQNNNQGMLWPFKWFLSKTCHPSGYEWPVAEAYFDVWLAPMMTEFTIMGPMEYACYNWGYLALRD